MTRRLRKTNAVIGFVLTLFFLLGDTTLRLSAAAQSHTENFDKLAASSRMQRLLSSGIRDDSGLVIPLRAAFQKAYASYRKGASLDSIAEEFNQYFQDLNGQGIRNAIRVVKVAQKARYYGTPTEYLQIIYSSGVTKRLVFPLAREKYSNPSETEYAKYLAAVGICNTEDRKDFEELPVWESKEIWSNSAPYRIATAEELKNPKPDWNLISADGIVRTKFYHRSSEELHHELLDKWHGDAIADVLIIGSGTAGLSAGIHATYAGLKTLVVESGFMAQTWSDAYMKSVHWQRTAPPAGIGLVQKGQSPKAALKHFDLFDSKVLSPLRRRGQEARQFVGEITHDTFLGQPVGSDEPDRTNVPVARNEVYQHMLDVADAMEHRNGFITEGDPVVSVEKMLEGIYRVRTQHGQELLTRKIIYAPGFVGEKAQNEKVAPILKGLVRSHTTNYTGVFDLEQAAVFSVTANQGRQLVITSATLGAPHVREWIRRLPAGATIAVVGTGESAAKSAVELFNVNPDVHVHYFAQYLEANPGQAPAQLKSPRLVQDGLYDSDLRDRIRSTLQEFGVPVTPPTVQALRTAESQGKLTMHLLGRGHYFDARAGHELRPRNADGETTVTDIYYKDALVATINGVFVSAVGYDASNISHSPLMKNLVANGLVQLDDRGDIMMSSDGISSATNADFFPAGAYMNNPQGLVVDGSVYGIVSRVRHIMDQIKGNRKVPSDDADIVKVIRHRALELKKSSGSDEGIGKLTFTSFLPGQDAETIRKLIKRFGKYPIEHIPDLVLASVQAGNDPDKIEAAYQDMMNTDQFPAALRAGLVLASVRGGQTMETIEKAYAQFSLYPQAIIPQLIIASVQPGQNPGKVQKLYEHFARKGYPVSAIPLLIRAAFYPLQDAAKVDAVYEEFKSYPADVVGQLVFTSVHMGQSVEKIKSLYGQLSERFSDKERGWLLRAAIAYFHQADLPVRQTPLSIAQYIKMAKALHLSRLLGGQRIKELSKLANRIVVTPEWLEKLESVYLARRAEKTEFERKWDPPEEYYSRLLLYHSKEEADARGEMTDEEDFEVVALVWEPGHRTAVHDHGLDNKGARNVGVVRVLQGTPRISNYRLDQSGDVSQSVELTLLSDVVAKPGQILPVLQVHQVINDTAERVFGLHTYSGIITEAFTFSPEAGGRFQRGKKMKAAKRSLPFGDTYIRISLEEIERAPTRAQRVASEPPKGVPVGKTVSAKDSGVRSLSDQVITEMQALLQIEKGM